MPFDGSGQFQRVMNWQDDAAAGINIKPDRADMEDDNFPHRLNNKVAGTATDAVFIGDGGRSKRGVTNV